jgi:capsid protein
MDAPDDVPMQVQKLLEEFEQENRWQLRQQEIVRRIDRDGEAFLRFFVDHAGLTRVRFIEPDQITTPTELATDAAASFGIQTDPQDVETVLGYHVDGEFVSATDVQHRRANVDFNVKRGLPLYTPVRKNLRRAEKLLRNMSIVAEIQSAIALIRKHRGASRSGIEQFVANQADATTTNNISGRTRHYSQYGPGTILDAPAGLEYDFPTQGLDASNFVAVLQAELRAIAARLVMPEFMFTSDASNANYSSTMVAEGPAMKMFERLQASMIEQDRAVMWRVVENAVAAGRLPQNVHDLVEIQIVPPSLHVRDPLRQAQVDRIAFYSGILSPQTWSQHLGLDYDQEQKNWSVHRVSRE